MIHTSRQKPTCTIIRNIKRNSSSTMIISLRFHIRNTKSGPTRHQRKSFITVQCLCNIVCNISKSTITFKILNIIYITFMPMLIHRIRHILQRTPNICKYNSVIMRPTGILAKLGNNEITDTPEIRYAILTHKLKPKLDISLGRSIKQRQTVRAILHRYMTIFISQRNKKGGTGTILVFSQKALIPHRTAAHKRTINFLHYTNRSSKRTTLS